VNSYIETADASVYTEVCYYPVTEGPRPVECVPLVEVRSEDRLLPWSELQDERCGMAQPNELNGARHPRSEFATLFDRQQVGGIFQHFTSMADGALRFGATQHFSAVFAASEEVPECESGHRNTRRRCEVMRPTESPTCVVGTPKNKFLDGIYLRLAPKTVAEVCYNPPSHSVSELPGRPPPARTLTKVSELVKMQIVRP